MPTEEEIRAWVRDEQTKIDKEKQDACNHAQSGTLNSEKKIVICDACGYEFKLGGDYVAADSDRFIEGQLKKGGK